MQKRFSDSDEQGRAGQLKHIKTDMGCWLWVGPLMGGYKQFKRKTPHDVAAGRESRGTNFLLHRVAFIARHGHDVTHTASHLCDNSACFNPMHIVDETMRDNNRRKGCKGDILCPFHGHILVRQCQHNPPCIGMQPPPGDVSCCLHDYLDRLPLPPSVPFASAPQPFGSSQLWSSRPSSSSGPSHPPGSSPPRLPGSSPRLAPAAPSSAVHQPVWISSSPPRSLPVSSVTPFLARQSQDLAQRILATDPRSQEGPDALRYYDPTDASDDLEIDLEIPDSQPDFWSSDS